MDQARLRENARPAREVLTTILTNEGAANQMRLLADRAVGRIHLNDARAVAVILDLLVEADPRAQTAVLLNRDLGTQIRLSNRQTASALLRALRKAGAHHQAEALTQRLPEAGLFDLFCQQPGNERLYRFGREKDGNPAPAWTWDDI